LVEDQQYFVLSRNADELWLKAALAVAYTFGFRKSELLLKMTVRQVDLKARSIRLYAGTTKNDEGRAVKMTSEVHDLLEACIRGKSAHDCVFTRKNGEPVRDFRGAWYALCERAGLGRFVKDEDDKKRWEGLIFHHLRWSTVRNMIRSGVSEKVAMKISGHKTRSLFDRYNIVNESDIEEAALKIENGREKAWADPSATTTATSVSESSEHSSTEAIKPLYIQ
jgi:integrase